MKKLLAIFLSLCLVLSLGITVFAGAADGASDPGMGTEAPPDKPDGDMGGGSGEGESGGSAEETTAVEDDGVDAVISYGDEGELTDREMTEGFELTFFDGGEKTESGLSGFLFTSEDPSVNLYFSELEEDTKEFYTIGGEAENISASDSYSELFTPAALEWMTGVANVAAYDSGIILKDSGSEDSAEPVISAKGWTYLNMNGLLMYVEGTARSAMYSDVVGGVTVAGPGSGGNQHSETPVVVIKNSLIETTGGTASDVEGAISFGNSAGRARGIQPQGKSATYLYNSAIVSRTWGAYSTDSARQNLDLVSYKSLGYSNNGYGAYADTSCHLYLYGTKIAGSSDGITASNDGEIYAVNSDSDLTSTDLREIMGKKASVDVSPTDYAEGIDLKADSVGSVITGGGVAVQFHMPDQQQSGAKNTKKATLYMQGGELSTNEELLGDNISAYVQHYNGALLVTKSTQANVLLEGTVMDSYNKVLIHSVINSDSNVNNIADGDVAVGSDYVLKDMEVEGDVINDDYQRALRLTLDGTTLTGAIYSNTCEDWNELCNAEFEGSYILNDSYETIWGVELTLDNGAVWNVTEESTLTGLTINDGTVNGTITENADGTITVTP